jgi:repressor of nif and glnA expression
VKLVGKESRNILGLPPQKIQEGLLVAGGILSIFVVVFAGIRAIIALLSTLGFLQLKKQVEDNSQIPLQPTT